MEIEEFSRLEKRISDLIAQLKKSRDENMRLKQELTTREASYNEYRATMEERLKQMEQEKHEIEQQFSENVHKDSIIKERINEIVGKIERLDANNVDGAAPIQAPPQAANVTPAYEEPQQSQPHHTPQQEPQHHTPQEHAHNAPETSAQQQEPANTEPIHEAEANTPNPSKFLMPGVYNASSHPEDEIAPAQQEAHETHDVIEPVPQETPPPQMEEEREEITSVAEDEIIRLDDNEDPFSNVSDEGWNDGAQHEHVAPQEPANYDEGEGYAMPPNANDTDEGGAIETEDDDSDFFFGDHEEEKQ